jgi:dTMP kinase
MLARVVFITFEGLDGSGKTTQVELLKRSLEADGREVVATREPGGTELGEHVREVVLHRHEQIVPWAEAALFAAARAQLVERVIAPALARGATVLCDRYIDSSLAYQGIARGATVLCDRYIDSSLAYQGIARGLGIDPVLELNLQATRGLLPDRTVLLLVDPAKSRQRYSESPDRIEREDDEFVARVDRAYRELAELFPSRILAVDGTQEPEELARTIYGQLRDLS